VEAFLSLFVSAFLSATLLPGSSEIILAALTAQHYDSLLLWSWATAGNTLGSCVNWLLGRYLLHFQKRRWFPVKPDTLQRAQRWFQHYGQWSLLMAWAPVFGDGLTLIAGILRVNFVIFFVLTAIGKGLRYAVILGLAGWLSGEVPLLAG
jgi:membrane protein YqaA with SNARE-associated domain